MPFKAVFFDLGGTLFRYADVRAGFDAMLQGIVGRYGIEAPFDEVRRAYRDAMAAKMAEYHAQSYYLHREMFTAAHREMLARFGKESLSDHELYEGQRDVGFDAVSPRDGVHDTLAALKEQGLHLAIVSNIDDDQFDPLWQRMGLDGFFDATTTSEEAQSCKPHAGIYHHALSKAPGIEAEEVVFVGDSPAHDVQGARRLGMTTVWITDRTRDLEPDQQPHHTIREIPELLEIVRA